MDLTSHTVSPPSLSALKECDRQEDMILNGRIGRLIAGKEGTHQEAKRSECKQMSSLGLMIVWQCFFFKKLVTSGFPLTVQFYVSPSEALETSDSSKPNLLSSSRQSYLIIQLSVSQMQTKPNIDLLSVWMQTTHSGFEDFDCSWKRIRGTPLELFCLWESGAFPYASQVLERGREIMCCGGLRACRF